MFVRALSRKRRTGAVPVYLNVYDLTTINGYAYWLGLGIYHSGVQVHGVEYAYGAHDHPTSGIFEGEPKQCPGFQFRKSILIGRTDLGPREVRSLMDSMSEDYTGNTYHLISKNCNHFCDDACIRLTGNGIPRWVNRLASIGFLCNCVLPVGLHVAETSAKEEKGRVIVRSEEAAGEEKLKLRNKSPRYTVSHPSSPPPTPSSPSFSNPSTSTTTTNDLGTLVSASSIPNSSNGEGSEKPTTLTRKKSRRRRSSSSSSSLVVTPSSAALYATFLH